MEKIVENQPGFSYVVRFNPRPGVYESLRVVARDGGFRVKKNYNNTITNHWATNISAVLFDTVEDAIAAIGNPGSLKWFC